MDLGPTSPTWARLAGLTAGLAAGGALMVPSASDAVPATDTASAAHPRVAARGSCDGWIHAVSGITGWLKSKDTCPRTSDDTITYSWELDPTFDTWLCVQGRSTRWSKKQDTFVHRWHSLGCGDSGGGTVVWRGPHGESVMGYPVVRAKAEVGMLPGGYAWAD